MRVIEGKNDLMFVPKDLNSTDKLIDHAHRIVPYLLSDLVSQASLELKQQASVMKPHITWWTPSITLGNAIENSRSN